MDYDKNYSLYFIKYLNLTDDLEMYVCYPIVDGVFEYSLSALDIELWKENNCSLYNAYMTALDSGGYKSYTKDEWKELLGG